MGLMSKRRNRIHHGIWVRLIGGEVEKVPSRIARQLVANGLAEYVKQPIMRYAIKEPPETR